MVGGIIEIAESGRSLRLDRGFVTVESGHEEIGRVPLDDVDVLILGGGGCTISSPLLGALAERGAVTLLCGRNYAPLGLLLPIEGMGESATRAKTQIEASEPLKKRLWQKMVREKILRQASVLESREKQTVAGNLRWLAKNVTSGDPDNKEAQAARKYWPELFGGGFLRSDEENPINGLLNYGYAVLRSATARSVVGAGLLPQFGVKHRGPRDSFALADDLMEAFRPLVDFIVAKLVDSGVKEVDSAAKRELARILVFDVATERGISTLSEALHISAISLVDSFAGKKECLCLPDPLEKALSMTAPTSAPTA